MFPLLSTWNITLAYPAGATGVALFRFGFSTSSPFTSMLDPLPNALSKSQKFIAMVEDMSNVLRCRNGVGPAGGYLVGRVVPGPIGFPSSACTLRLAEFKEIGR